MKRVKYADLKSGLLLQVTTMPQICATKGMIVKIKKETRSKVFYFNCKMGKHRLDRSQTKTGLVKGLAYREDN